MSFMNESEIDTPTISLDFLLTLMPREIGERFAQVAQIRGATDSPELLDLLASLLETAMEKQEKDQEQAHQEAFLQALEKGLV